MFKVWSDRITVCNCIAYLLNPSWIDFHKNKFELKVIKVLQRLLLIHQYLKLNFDSIKAHMWFASKVFHQIHLLKKKNLLCLKKLSVFPLNFCAEMRREEVVLKSSREAQSYTSQVLYILIFEENCFSTAILAEWNWAGFLQISIYRGSLNGQMRVSK